MDDIEKLKASFRQEASDLLADVEHHLLELEAEPDQKDLVRSIYRTAHTLKGSSSRFEFGDVEQFLHLIENFLDSILKSELHLTKEDIKQLFQSVDQTRLLINEPQHSAEPEAVELRKSISNYISQRLQSSTCTLTSSENLFDSTTQSDSSQTTWKISLRFSHSYLENEPDIKALFAELDELGDTTYSPDPDSALTKTDLPAEYNYLYWEITLVSDCDEQDIADVFLFVDDSCEIKIKQLEEETSSSSPQDASVPAPGNDESELIKINSSDLDDLLNMVGELVINQSRLNNQSGSHSEELENTIEENQRLVDLLQDKVMNMRMLAVDTLALRFRRMVRDISNSMDKRVKFVLEGGDTELDKSMLDALVDPVMHLLRNAIDHGVEPTDERLSAGKPEEAQIHMSAYQYNGEFVLSIRDDGSGIDPEKVYRKALDRQLIKPDEALSTEEKCNLIFKSGLSTRNQVTNVSGRGMGMDVVKRAIDGMGGRIKVESEPGQFTEFTIRLPLTLAITECLLVSVAQQVYGIPVSYIERIENYAREETSFRERPLVHYNDTYIPFLRLRSVFTSTGDHPPLEKMILIHHQDRAMGILVDSIIGNIQAVMKPLPTMFRNAPAISSSTILGDGSVGLILDVPKLGRLCREEEQAYLNAHNSNNHHSNTSGDD